MAYGRSFSRVTAVQGSGHFAGFIGQYVFNNGSQGVQPTFLFDPSFSNGNTVDYWQGQEATRAPESNFWTFTIQRQLTTNTTLEVGYNANAGSHLQTGILNFNQVPVAAMEQLASRVGMTQALTILRSNITSANAVNNGFRPPFPAFASLWGGNATVAQSLRPYPQYGNINTGVQNGDKSGNSSYHALVIKADRRFSKSFSFQWSYVFSKLLTDSDTYFATGNTTQDHGNRRLEKSIGAFDQTHVVKFSTLYNLPFGKGERWATKGFLSHVIGGWRLAAIQVYNSGNPIALTRNNPFPIFNYSTRPTVDAFDNWRAPVGDGGFDPGRDRFMKPSNQFPAQGNVFGNVTRYNPKVRAFWGQSENISIAKTFNLGERFRVDVRGEGFNIFNRAIFGTGSTNLNAGNFGQVFNQANDPRQMQVGLKVYW
jgi:hypothetical protein